MKPGYEGSGVILDNRQELWILKQAFTRTDIGHLVQGEMPTEVLDGKFGLRNRNKTVLLNDQRTRLAILALKTFEDRYSGNETNFTLRVAAQVREGLESCAGTLD